MLQIQASGSQSCVCALGKQEQRCALRIEATHCYYQSNLRVFIPLLPSVRKAVMSKYIKDKQFPLHLNAQKTTMLREWSACRLDRCIPDHHHQKQRSENGSPAAGFHANCEENSVSKQTVKEISPNLTEHCTGTWWFICSKYGYLTCLYIQTAKHETSLESTVCDADTEVRSDLISWISAGLHR